MIIDHDNELYRMKWMKHPENRFNGAFYYSKEIVKNIIPEIKTDRNWVTLNIEGVACDHSIIFIHNNLHPERYDWLKSYKDLVLVCGVESTMDKVKHLGKPLYLPLSVDVDYVSKFKCPKSKSTAFVGRRSKKYISKFHFPLDINYIENLPRDILLEKMAIYKRIYAVGRVAIEGKILGCEILPYDERYPDPSIWKILDNKDAAKILQEQLYSIDGR